MICPINNYKSTVNFGFAKLNETGRKAADSFGLGSNEFLDSSLYKKQGPFRKSALSKELSAGKTFPQICEEYGCTSIGKANAEFISSQILSGKSNKAMHSVPKKDLKSGFLKLYGSNYDNPDLSSKDTLRLLKIIKNYVAPEEYIKNIGLLQEGTDK